MTKYYLKIIRRSLAALDQLEEQGASVNVIRADLTTVADGMETALQAEGLARRQAQAVGVFASRQSQSIAKGGDERAAGL